MEKKKDNLSTVRVHEDLASEVDRIVESDIGKQMGFRSRADFFTEAVRDYIRSDMTPVPLPGGLLKRINLAIQRHPNWASSQGFIIESLNMRLDEIERG